MAEYTYMYTVGDEDVQFATSFDTDWDEPNYPSYVAEDAAKDYDSNGNWSDNNDDLVVTIWKDGDQLGTFGVCREFEPTYYAKPK